MPSASTYNPLEHVSEQLKRYREARPQPYAPLGFDFKRPEPDYSSFNRNLASIQELSRAGTNTVRVQAAIRAEQEMQAELARLQELANQSIDLSGITPRYTGNRAPENPRQADYYASKIGKQGFGQPLRSYRVTSGYGPRSGRNVSSGRISSNHTGIDLAAPMGTPIYATHDGVIQFAGWQGGYGNLIKLGGGNGLQTYYAHQSRFAVRAGTRVRRGQIIGYVGSTGRSTGPHLHYEIRIGGRHINPRGYL